MFGKSNRAMQLTHGVSSSSRRRKPRGHDIIAESQTISRDSVLDTRSAYHDIQGVFLVSSRQYRASAERYRQCFMIGRFTATRP